MTEHYVRRPPAELGAQSADGARIGDVQRGTVRALMGSMDWASTDVGPPESWPRSLTSYVSMVLEMPTPAIIFWGPNQTQLYNDGYAAIMGPRHPAYLAAPYRECWPETYPVIYPWMQRVLHDGEVVQVTDHLVTVTRHGFAEEAYFTFTFSALRDDDGAIAGVFQPVVEVTDRVLSERRSKTLRLIATATDAAGTTPSASPMDALSASGRDVPWSLVYLRRDSGTDLELAMWSGFGHRALQPSSEPGFGEVARRAFETGIAQRFEADEPHLADHLGRWPEPTRSAYAVPLRRGSIEGVLVAGISPRLRFDERYEEFIETTAEQLAATLSAAQAQAIEKELLAREREARRDAELQREHLASLLMQAPTPMVVLRGPELVVELANPRACEVWRRAHADVIGRPIIEALPELRGHAVEHLLRRVYATGVSYVGEEVEAQLGRDDQTHQSFFNFVYAPLRLPDGSVDGVLVIAFDVTEQIRAREQVDGLRAAAEAANRAKDEFFAILGHELRNPLAPILTALELMRLRAVPEVEKERQVIERQARHLVRLVGDLLDISRVTRGKIALHKERVELADVIERALETARPLVEQRRHELVLDVDARLIVDADSGRLTQAIANLLTNAAKYTEVGGRISVRATRAGELVQVRVRDTGIGIDPKVLPHVYDAFVQERQALDRSEGGLGLGLAIVRAIVDLHGGSIEIRSDGRGTGTEAILVLPAAPPGRPARAAEAPVRPSASAEHVGRRILIVDDNQDAADALSSWLTHAGHRVRVACDGPSGLALAREQPPDIALLDIGLPVMDGYELARRIREIASLEQVPLIAVTGYGQPADRQRSKEAGFDAHMVKPVDAGGLDAVIRSLTSRTREQARRASPPSPREP